MIRVHALALTTALLLGLTAAAASPARAQAPAPIPKLDLAAFTEPWYEIARLPNRREKQCVADNLILYGLGDKANTFQLSISCLIKDNNWNYWNQAGKLDPQGSGRLRLTHFWLFHTSYWVLAAAPNMDWIVVGTPHHKFLWILSRTPTLPPDTLAAAEAQARAQGFDTAKLVQVPQRGGEKNPEYGLQASATNQSGAAPSSVPQTPNAPRTELAPATGTTPPQPQTAPQSQTTPPPAKASQH